MQRVFHISMSFIISLFPSPIAISDLIQIYGLSKPLGTSGFDGCKVGLWGLL